MDEGAAGRADETSPPCSVSRAGRPTQERLDATECVSKDDGLAIDAVGEAALFPLDAALADVWETGGPVASVDQGGDATPPWQLEPRARGMKVLSLEMMPTDTGPGSGDEGWHATDTIDVDIVIDGAVELYLPDLPPVSVSAGDILIQRATNHRWRAIGDHHLRMITIMIAVHS